MVLLDSIKKSFNCVIENPSITLFLVLFLIGSNILASYILTARTQILAIVLLLCLFAFLFAFFSGWFKVLKESIDREKIKEKNFYSIFLEGIGENVISVSIATVLYGITIFAFVIIAQIIALKFFGDITFFIEGLNKITSDNGNFIEYFNNLDVNQKYIVYGWNICIIASVALFNFLTLFYFPALTDNKKNVFLRPFIAIWDSLKFLFKNFFGAIFISIFIYVLNMIIAYFNAIFAQNMILSVLMLLLYIYFISYVVMLIFNYYEAKNNCFNGTNSVGEDEAGDSTSEEA